MKSRRSWNSPVTRPLQVYAFDPSLGRRHGNHMTVWVANDPRHPLRPGPRSDRVAVIDYDGANERYYEPVDLDDDDILMQNGLPPSEFDPRFHQQMVFAVASRTIEVFDSALGRRMRWLRQPRPLRVFPHALREPNAYYDADHHALLFGYFSATTSDAGANLPGQTIFSCLSHDIIAHETTHALVHSIRRHYMQPTNVDTLAFHEAFADLIALFQHFTFKEALLDHVLRTGGVLFRAELAPLVAPLSTPPGSRPSTQAEEAQKNVLVDLARQFGEAMGLRAALRAALRSPPKPEELEKQLEPHRRGAILVAAVFDAFFTVYSNRMADLLRIARQGGGGELSYELADRLAREAAKTATHFLNMCIRALDYCPPVDITFGDFLRALITVDYDLVRDDDLGYRDILIESFRRRGIRPLDVASFSESSLRWQPPDKELKCPGLLFDVIHGNPGEVDAHNARVLNRFAKANARALGLDPRRPIQPHTFHPVHRVGPDGQLRFQVIVELIQRRRVSVYPRLGLDLEDDYFGGTTLVLNARDDAVLYSISKSVRSEERLERQHAYWELRKEMTAETYSTADWKRPPRADFAVLHRGY